MVDRFRWVFVLKQRDKQKTLFLAPCRGEFKAIDTGRLGEAHFSGPLRGTLVVKSAKSRSESTFFSRVTRVPPTPNSCGQLPRRLLWAKRAMSAPSQAPRPSLTAQVSSVSPLKDSEREFQVRAARLARPREIQSQEHIANPGPASLPSPWQMWPRNDASLCAET